MQMELVRYVLPHLLAGSVAGLVAAVVLVATCPSLRDLVLHADGGWLGFGLLIGGCVLTFGSAAMGHAIMMIGQDDDPR
jgi:type IV secretory pathway VirB2 component (pilin)